MKNNNTFFSVNIREFLESSGQDELAAFIADFSCPQNVDVEYFLKHNAIEFTKKNQSVTYIVFTTQNIMPVGYFTITSKPLTINRGRGYSQQYTEKKNITCL